MSAGSCDFNPCIWVQALTREHPKVRLVEAGLRIYLYLYILVLT